MTKGYSSKLHFLHLEDNPTDVELVQAILEEQWPECSIDQVETEADFLAVLAKGGVDIILADYSLPTFDGMSAMAIVQKKCPDIPFLFVSGTMGEEIAIETMKNGATDYVLKQRLSRLVPAVQRALREKEEYDEHLRLDKERLRLLNIIERSINEIHIVDPVTFRFKYANASALRNLGYSAEEFQSLTPADINPEFNQEKINSIIGPLLSHEKNLLVLDTVQRRCDGSLYQIEIHLQLVDMEDETVLLVIGNDITERSNLEKQLIQSQKLEAVGTLAGGIAHDFNNILTAIIGYSTLLKMEPGMSDMAQEYLGNLLALSERAANLTKGLLAFSRNQVMYPKLINLNDVINIIFKLITRLIGDKIAIETHLSTDPITVMADSGQIELVLMNLATNARDAMPDGGKLIISTELVDLEAKNIPLAEPLTPGQYALITVSDTGCGMDETTLARIFEPFFTTKEPGKGTGLGLSIIYGIVKQHHGIISADSRLQNGTTFSIYLPLTGFSPGTEESTEVLPVQGGFETILLADDDEEVRMVICRILKQYDYRVIEAADGEEAVSIFREQHASIAIVLLDAIMPKMSGKEAYKEIIKLKPDVKVLFTSGYPSDDITQGDLLPEGVDFLPKPASPIDLLRSIRQILNRQKAA